jgi:diguanylate cyclase (GGDEF)-like protein
MVMRWTLLKKIDLRTRVILLVLLTGIPIASVLAVQGMALHREKVNNIFEASTTLALKISQQPKEIIPDPGTNLLTWSRLPEMTVPDRCSNLHAFFDPLLKAFPYFTTLAVLGPDGKRICPEPQENENADLSDREYFRRMLATKTYTISNLLTGRLSKRTSIIFAQPVLDEGSNLKYVVLLGLDTKWLEDTLNKSVSSADMPKEAVAVVVDNNGTIVASAPHEYGRIGSRILDWTTVQPRLSATRELTREEIWLDGVRRATAYIPFFDSPNGGLRMRVGIPIEPGLNEVNKDHMQRVILIAVILMVALALAWYTGERLVLQPIRKIWSAANSLRMGNFSTRVGNVKASGELGELALAFDGMAEQIQEDRQRLQFQAMHDPLTGLANRFAIREQITSLINNPSASASGIGVILLDLDGFKEINDSLGHPLGDRVLVHVAQTLVGFMNGQATAGRLGGDEFVILVEGVQDRDAFKKIAWNLREQIRRPINVDEHQFILSASIGIAMYPGHGNDVDTLLQNADVAMYRAKSEKMPGYCIYDPAMNELAPARLKMQNLLSQAVAKNELVLYYQPKIGAMSGKVTGVEALVRWNSEELGFVSPADFIPLAEHTGLIVEIGEWVLKTACAQLKAWEGQVPDGFSMAVNLSPRQFADPELSAKISRLLEHAGIAASQLELEITEGAIMHDPAQAVDVLNQLRNHGIKVAVDDFGTGYSSLSYLKHLPIDAIKIDKSFVDGLPGDTRDRTIVSAVIAIAKELKLRVTAEGVELDQQVRELQALGCDEFQGYFFERPLPAKDFLATLQSPDCNCSA